MPKTMGELGQQLTTVQREALQLAAYGHTREGIATLMHLHPETVNNHLCDARAKLGAKNTAEAVAIALRDGWIV